ncbi:MAG: class I SAM-dependent methyltransferase [Thermoplasmata archaeon]
MTEPAPRATWPDLESRQANFDRIYATQKERFAGPPSRFSTWALARLAPRFPDGALLDLGCGLGRDARRFAAAGYSVRATDYSRIAVERARSDPQNPASLTFERADAVHALCGTPAGSLVAVYAHALYMMLPDEELEAVFRGVRRALRPGGLHLFAVRSVTDPVAGQGEEVAPDVWRRPRGTLEGGPDPAPYRYFRPESLDRLTATGFERVEAELDVAPHFWFMADRRP